MNIFTDIPLWLVLVVLAPFAIAIYNIYFN